MIRRRFAALAALVLSAVLAGLSPAAAGPPQFLPDELLVGFRGGLSEADMENTYRVHGGAKLERLRGLAVHRIRVPVTSIDAIERVLGRHPHVKFVERNGILAPDATANDPYFSSQYHLQRIAATQAWDLTVGSAAVIIAVLDTGVDGTHPDLASKMVPGYNFYDNNTDTADVHGHGTKVSGSATAISNNGVGVAGVSWESRLMPIRVSDPAGYAYYSTIANGLTWAADRGARVMNISFSGVASSSTIASAAQYVRNKGGVVVAASGNCGCVDATPENPYLISVGATDSNDALASFSSRGAYVDVSAPGVSIVTTTRGGGYAGASGTSFASPITAGVVALMMAANPALSPADLEATLEATADDLGATGWDQGFGSGRINAYRAVAVAASGAPAPDTTAPGASITSPAAGASLSGTVSVAVAASDDTGVSRVEVYVDGALIGDDTTAPYGVAWDTKRALNGAHTLTAVAYDAAGNAGASAPVSVTVSNSSDTTAPTVTRIETSRNRDKLSVNVTATDNVGVTKVELYVDGVLKSTDSSNPWAFSVNLKQYPAGTHTIDARALDAAGNAGWSSGGTTFVK